MAANKTGVFVRSNIIPRLQELSLIWIPRSKPRTPKSLGPLWAAHTRMGIAPMGVTPQGGFGVVLAD